MNIQVRIVTAQAQARIRQLEAEMYRLNRGMGAVGHGSRAMEGGFARAMTAGNKFGNQLQWTGRQLQYNFAMPLAIAGGLATKFALENEAAMVRVEKVYGDATKEVEDFGGEIKALERNFKALSNHFGVHRAEVIKIAGDWAAVGATGVALAKAVKLTLETMVLGEMQAAEATEALIAVQGQYNLSINELSQSMDTLNMIENETDTSMAQLITSMSRAAGTARQAGVSVAELAAMTAALVPEAGKASLAGNGLKTIISRLLAPTEDAAAILGKMGFTMQDLDWQSLNVTQRLQALADAFVKLPEGQRAVVGEYAAGRWQITRFNQLLMDVADRSGDYHKAMNVSADATKNYRQRVRELNAVLDSNPQKMKQVKVMLENTMADIIQPMLPAIVFLAQKIAQLAQSFANLDPTIQMLVGSVALLLLVIGPLLRYIGSSITLFSTLGAGIKYLIAPFAALKAAMFGTATAAVASNAMTSTAFATGGATQSGLVAGTAARITGIWASMFGVMNRIAAVGWVNQVSTAAAASAAQNIQARRAAGQNTAETAAQHAKLKAMWQAFWAKRRAQDSAATSAEIVLRRTAGAATVAAEAATASSVIAERRMMHTMLLGQDGVYYTASTARNAGFNGTIIEGELATGQARASAHARGLAMLAAASDAFKGQARAKWTGFWSWMTARHQAWMLRMGAIGQVGFGRMGAFESAALTASRARWTAYWMQLSVMQKGAAAKMVATDVAMKSRVASMALLKKIPLGWAGVFLVVIGLAYHFRDNIAAVFIQARDWIAESMTPLAVFFDKLGDKIVESFYRLPKGVQNAMLAVINIVHTAAMKVYELFSYLNPFARHSPSLVENVTAGMAIVSKQFATMGNAVNGILRRASANLAAFKAAAANLGIDEWSDKRMEVSEGLPQMLPLFDRLTGDLKDLNSVLARQGRAVSAQEAVVKRWRDSLDAANVVVDTQRKKLDGLRETLQGLEDQYDSHERAMQNYANAPIQGMGKMSDAIFENEIAQKKLRLEIMDWEDANGSIDSVRNRLALLQGEIESGKAEAADLRAAGAGSDILGPIEAEIAAMEEQANATSKALEDSPVNKLQQELEALERASARMDLERAIEFDPLLREIDKLANGMEELPFDKIIAGINQEQAAMDALTPKIDAATKAVEAQELALERVTAARDAIQDSYDAESAKLDVLQDQYRETEVLIRDIEAALNDVSGAARDVNVKARKAAADAKGPQERWAVEKFDMAAAADFADVGGSGKVDREFPEIDDQSALIDEMTRQLTEDTAKLFGEFDMLEPFKKAWSRVVEWWNTSAWPMLDPVFGTLGRSISEAWGKMFDGEGFELAPLWDQVVEKIKAGGEKVRGGIQFITDIIMSLWRLAGPDMLEALDNAWESIKGAFEGIGSEVAKYADLWDPIKKAADVLWLALQGAFIVGFAVITLVWKTAWSILAEIVGPIIDVISDTIENALQIIRGIIQVVLSLITGDWRTALKGIGNVVAGALDLIWDLFKGAGKLLWGVVKGLVQGIFGWFQWLYREVVGNSVVPDLINAIWEYFKKLLGLPKWIYDNVLKPVFDFFVSVGKWIWDKVVWTKDKVFEGFSKLRELSAWMETNVGAPIRGFFAGLGQWLWDKAIWIKDKIYEGFGKLKELAIWWDQNVSAPIRNAFTWLWDNALRPLLNRMLRGFANIFNNIGGAIARGVNVGISAINKLIDALNWVGKSVPGLNFSITPVGKVTWSDWTPPQFETGGVLPSRVGEGFATSHARAIVGEGRTAAPEYVIPTDPRHRNNALRLYGELGNQLGVAPIGGWGWDIPGVDIAGAAQKVGSTIRRGAVAAATGPFLKAFDALVGGMPDKPDPLKRMIVQAKNNAVDWLKGVDGKIPDVAPPGNVGHEPLPGHGWGAIEAFLKANGDVSRYITSTYRPGDRGFHGRGLAIDYSIPGHGNKGYDHPGLRSIFDALLPAAGNLAELILAGAPFNIKNGRKVPGYAWGEPGRPGNHWNHVHAAAVRASTRVGGVQEFAKGGIVHGAVQGVMGEAGTELITPLTPLWNRLDRIESMTAQRDRGGSTTVININGNLEFPNISDGGDAEEFVRNLEIMARR